MKLIDILNPTFKGSQQEKEWIAKGYQLPQYDVAQLQQQTYESPTWVHFGGGNIFRAFPATMLQQVLNTGKYDRGVIMAETFDYEIIDTVYNPYKNLSLSVSLCPNGTVEKQVIASVTEALKADYAFPDWQRLVTVFKQPSLQMITFTITEKGYVVPPADLERGLTPACAMGKVAVLLLERFRAGQLPLTIQSLDNCSHNGDKLKAGILTVAQAWVNQQLAPQAFLDYLQDQTCITFPWSMIDKITPRPHQFVQQLLQKDGFEDVEYIETQKHTFTAPFVNAEEVQYLVIEDHYTHGRPPLDEGGALYTSREIVDKVETMKVTTCLNPLHTALAIFGCLLDYTLISAEMKDEDLRVLVQKLGYIEMMPVVTDPGILNPYEFIGDVINKRLPNPFMPDAPQRIAMDTSQKLPIRFGQTLLKYQQRNLNVDNLILIPLVIAGYARYLKGLNDDLQPFNPSPDPLLEELQAIIAPLEIGKPDQDWSPLKTLFSRKDIFAVDIYELGIGQRAEQMAKELFSGAGAVRQTVHQYTYNR